MYIRLARLACSWVPVDASLDMWSLVTVASCLGLRLGLISSCFVLPREIFCEGGIYVSWCAVCNRCHLYVICVCEFFLRCYGILGLRNLLRNLLSSRGH